MYPWNTLDSTFFIVIIINSYISRRFRNYNCYHFSICLFNIIAIKINLIDWNFLEFSVGYLGNQPKWLVVRLRPRHHASTLATTAISSPTTKLNSLSLRAFSIKKNKKKVRTALFVFYFERIRSNYNRSYNFSFLEWRFFYWIFFWNFLGNFFRSFLECFGWCFWRLFYGNFLGNFMGSYFFFRLFLLFFKFFLFKFLLFLNRNVNWLKIMNFTFSSNSRCSCSFLSCSSFWTRAWTSSSCRFF